MIRDSSGRMPTVVTPSGGMRSSTASPEQEEIEMQPIQNPRRPRAAISGQRELHPLQLGDTAANTNYTAHTTTNNTTANTGNTPPRRTRLTDAEMMEAEPNWGRDERARAESYHTRHFYNPGRFTTIEREQARPLRLTTYFIPQADGTTAQSFQEGRAGHLLPVEEGRNLRSSMEQKMWSRRYFWASGLTPVTAVMFGLGYFDRHIAAKTEGRVTRMHRTDKWHALALLAPLSLMLWVIVVVLVFLAVEAGRKGGLQGEHQ